MLGSTRSADGTPERHVRVCVVRGSQWDSGGHEDNTLAMPAEAPIETRPQTPESEVLAHCPDVRAALFSAEYLRFSTPRTSGTARPPIDLN